MLRILLLTALLFPTPGIAADLLETTSKFQSVSLIPVTKPDISGQEPLIQRQLQTQRQKVVSLLGNATTSRNQLAKSLGRLAALYQAYKMSSPAESSLENAKRLAPDDILWIYYSAWLAQQSGLTELALQRYLEAQRLEPDYAPLALRLGQVLIELNQPIKAQQYLDQSLEVPGLRAATLYASGQIDLLQRNYAAAVTKLKAARQLAPNAGRINYVLAQALRGANQSAAAKIYFAKNSKGLPTTTDPYIDDLRVVKTGAGPTFKLAMAAVKTKNYAAAVEKFTQGLTQDPENIHARISLARSRYLSGDADGAFNELKVALKKQPGHSLSHFLIAILFDAMGQTGSARKHYHQSIQHDPENSGALFYLANLEFTAGHFKTAIKYYQRSLEQTDTLIPARLYQEIAKSILGQTHITTLKNLEPLRNDFVLGHRIHYVIAKLLSTPTDATVFNPERALQIAKSLVNKRPGISNLRLLALTLAINGRFDLAVETQRQAIASARWLQIDLNEYFGELTAYLSGKKPRQKNLLDDPMLVPPAVIPAIPFQNYPAPKSF